MNIDRETADKYQGLFNYLNDQYGINPTIEGMNDLIAEVDKTKQLLIPLVVLQSEQLPKNNCTLNRQTCGKGSGCKYPHCHI